MIFGWHFAKTIKRLLKVTIIEQQFFSLSKIISWSRDKLMCPQRADKDSSNKARGQIWAELCKHSSPSHVSLQLINYLLQHLLLFSSDIRFPFTHLSVLQELTKKKTLEHLYISTSWEIMQKADKTFYSLLWQISGWSGNRHHYSFFFIPLSLLSFNYISLYMPSMYMCMDTCIQATYTLYMYA